MKETIKIEGMKCMHCVLAVKGALEEIKGVSSVDVALEYGTATVEFDENVVSIEALQTAIEEQGFDVV